MTDILIRQVALLSPGRDVGIADIAIEDGVITDVGRGLSTGAATVIDGDGMLAMPGLINAHTHSGQHLDRGVTPNLPLDLWLAWTVLGGLPRDADYVYTTAISGALEMLRSGCTSVLDHVYIDPGDFDPQLDALLAAYRDIGIRVAVAPMLGDFDLGDTFPWHLAPDAQPPRPGTPADTRHLVALMESFVSANLDQDPRIHPLVGPSAPQRCSDEYLEENARLMRDYGVGMHTHVLETKSQVLATRERYGGSVVAHLQRLGMLREGTSLAHCVWADDDDLNTIAGTGSTIVHNPISNLRCGSGVFPLTAALDKAVPVAVGADGAASNDNQNMFEALKFATLVHTLRGSHQAWPPAERVWQESLRGGSMAMGSDVGRLEAGALADIALLRLDRHVLADRTSLVAGLVYAEHGESVDTVLVHGRVVVENGRSVLVDEAEINRRARALQRRIHDRMPQRQAIFDQWAPGLERIERTVAEADVGIERRLADPA